ncbi:MAG: PAS domain-containing protein [Thermoplasmatales archaeon]|nr:MAG: PAS domain-containing protein [Thermoplasmatales archaeon]
MKRINYILWYFPFCFFVFLAIYIFIKFLFIFFFRAAYEPEFMFDLTPYYILSGVNNLHLLFLSLIAIIFDAYLHANVSKRYLLFSFFPTGVMLSGLGLKIASGEMVLSNFFHYLTFGCLLVIMLIDHKHILIFPEIIGSTKKESMVTETAWRKPAMVKVKPQPPKVSVVDSSLRLEDIDKILTCNKKTMSGLRILIKDDLQRAEAIIEDLERKTRKIDRLGEELEERRNILVKQERMFNQSLISSKIHVKSPRSNNRVDLDANTQKETSEDHTFIDNVLDCAVIVQRGILKQVNNPFIELLGYDINEVIGKSLFNFITPECCLEIEKYYLDRLKGVSSSDYKAVFLTKDNNKLAVKVSTRPTIFNGKKAEIVIIKELKNI